jgi:hypothetical protein
VKRVLRWFPQYRWLEHCIESFKKNEIELGGDIRGLQGELHALRGELDALRKERDKAVDSERSAYRMLVNVEMKTKHGFAPFQDAPAPPDRPAADMTPINSYTSVRDQIRAGEQEFRAEMAEMFKED